jgi:hypothetical protein
MASLLRTAVQRDLGDPDRTVVFLSGGVDSRAIVSVAHDVALRHGKLVRTVTWAAPGATPGSDRDVAQAVSTALGTRHTSVVREVSGWGRRLVDVTYLLDGLTDVSAYHPHEHAVMRELKSRGALAVMRGDECFGWERAVGSVEEAWLSLNLRSPRRLRFLDTMVAPPVLARLSAAVEASLAEAASALSGEHPDNAKDLLYFRHRLQGYLGSAAYLKQVVLDHHAPLLDDALLDLNARVPARLRVNKRLFQRAAERLAPGLFRIPLACRGNLEDWSLLLASHSPVRAHVEAELDDGASGLWELFHRERLVAALPPIGGARRGSPSELVERALKRAAHTALRVAPRVERMLETRSHRAGLRFDQLCLRVMVLKAWHDLFVEGDGSRRALDAKLARLES